MSGFYRRLADPLMQQVRQFCRANIAATVQCMIAFMLLGVIGTYVLGRLQPSFILPAGDLVAMVGGVSALVGAVVGQVVFWLVVRRA